jgi:hypothetical protein
MRGVRPWARLTCKTLSVTDEGMPRAFQLGKLSCMLVWINLVRDFAWLSMQSITRSILEALRAFESVRAFVYAHDITERDQANIVNIEDYYSAWKGKVLLNKWKLMTFLKSSNANWTWQWKYYYWFTFFDLVNSYRQMWPFLFILYRPRIVFPQPSFFFQGPRRKRWIEVSLYKHSSLLLARLTSAFFGTARWKHDFCMV